MAILNALDQPSHTFLNLASNDPENKQRLIYGQGTSKQQWLAWKGLSELKPFEIETHFPKHSRVVILAPHPDDEILGCGGLLQKLSKLQRNIVLIAVTNGTKSHPDSTLYTEDHLNQIRPAESKAALEVLDIQNIQRIALNLKDGAIAISHAEFYAKLEQLLEPNDILVTTYEKDGHPDHEHSAYVVSQICKKYQLKYYQVLIWTWHWAAPNNAQIEWEQAYRLDLDSNELEMKHRAIQCFKSQLEIDSSTGQAPILSSEAVDRILMPYEVYMHGQ